MSADELDERLNIEFSRQEREIGRELWRPDRNEQMAAIEILLASSIPTELRQLLREREFALATRSAA